MRDSTESIPLKLPNGAQVHVEVTKLVATEEDEDVSAITEIAEEQWKEVTHAVEGIAEWVNETLQKVQPSKAAVEFGIELALEPGKITALWVKGSGKANLKITLEWSKK